MPHRFTASRTFQSCFILAMLLSIAPVIKAANPAPPATNSANTLARQPGDLMDLLVIDQDTKQPIPKTDIYSFGLPDRFVGVTGADGHVQLPIPFAPFNYFIIAVRPKGWAFKRMLWQRNSKPEDIPDTYTMEMRRAVRVHGTVLDEQDQPIAGAGVIITFHKKLTNPFEQLDTAGHGGTTSIKTNARGTFNYIAAPPDCEGIDIAIVDNRYPRPADAPSPFKPVSKLYDGTAIITVKSGVALTGIVTDTQSKPIPGATITAGEAVGEIPPPTATSDADGKFTLVFRPGESTVITVQAKGFAPELKIVVMTDQPQSITVPLSADHGR